MIINITLVCCFVLHYIQGNLHYIYLFRYCLDINNPKIAVINFRAFFLLCIAQFINIVSFNAIKYQPIPSLNWHEFIKAFDPHIIFVLSFTDTGVYIPVEKFTVGCFPRARAFRLNGLRNAWTSHCSKMFVIKNEGNFNQ